MRRLSGVIVGVAILGMALMALGAPARAQNGDTLTAPRTLVERPTDSRSAADIRRDNDISAAVDKAMADIGTIRASTEVYEQRLLVTGVFDNQAAYDRFEQAVRVIRGVKRLYWQVVFVSRADQESRQQAGTMIDWPAALAMETKAKGRLTGAAGVADVNFRVAADAFATLYVLGRARSQQERDRALDRARDGEGVKRVVNYIDVRP